MVKFTKHSFLQFQINKNDTYNNEFCNYKPYENGKICDSSLWM